MSDVWRLDTFEGSMYERRRVKVRLVKAQRGPASKGSKSTNKNTAPALPPGTQVTGTRPAAPAPHDNEVEEGEIETSTYVWDDPVEDLEEQEWDFGEFVREKLWRWAGAEADREGEYDEVDEAVKEAEQGIDPTGGRFVGGDFDKKLNGH